MADSFDVQRGDLELIVKVVWVELLAARVFA